MAVKNPQFEINIRQNDNSSSNAYGKYYPKAVEKKTISLRGLTNHMAGHNCIYGRDVIEGVLTKMSSCITELISQGNPVKIDGLGTFVPTVESVKEGISEADLLAGKWNAATYVKAIHIRFRPEGSGDDDITSRNFKGQCALTTIGVEEKIDLTPEETDPKKKKFIKRITPLDDWIKEHGSGTTEPGNSGSTDSGNSGNGGSDTQQGGTSQGGSSEGGGTTTGGSDSGDGDDTNGQLP